LGGSRSTRVDLYVERLDDEGTMTAKLSLGTPSVAALFGVDVFDFSFDDDCEWVGGSPDRSRLLLQ
jgi:hypothetical protein